MTLCMIATLLPAQLDRTVCPDPPDIPVFDGTPETTLCDSIGNFPVRPNQIGAGTAKPNSSDVGTFISGYVHILGDFVIDNQFTFLNAIVLIEPGVTISIAPSFPPFSTISLDIDNSKLFACDDLWSGIYVTTASTLRIYNNTVIEDAESAVNAHLSLTTVEIENTHFNRNRVGLTTSCITSSCGRLSISNSFFTCTAPLNGTNNEITFAGIRTINYPYIMFAENTFEGIQYGIRAEGSGVGQSSSVITAFHKFYDIHQDGIFIENGDVFVLFGEFVNCASNGIFAQRTRRFRVTQSDLIYNEDLLSNNLSGASQYAGIRILGFNSGSRIRIRDFNDFSAILPNDNDRHINFIHLEGGNVGANTTIDITDNDFNMNVANSHVLYMTGDFPESSSTDFWFNNPVNYDPTIDNNTNPAAIFYDGGTIHNFNISNNVINGPSVYDGKGIYLFGSFNGTERSISYNTINGNPNGSLNYGIENFIFPNTTINCNTIDHTGFGMVFTSLNRPTIVQENTFKGCNLAIRNGVIGEQIDHGNEWYDTFIGGGCGFPLQLPAIHAQCVPPFNAFFNTFIVHKAQSTGGPPPSCYTFFTEFHPERIVPDFNDDFFRNAGIAPSTNCLAMIEPTKSTNATDTLIATGAMGSYFSPAMVWQLEFGLYSRLQNSPSLIADHPSFASFLSSRANTSVGQLYAIFQLTDAAFSADSSQTAQAGQWLDEQADIIEDLEEADSIYLAASFQWQKTLALEMKDSLTEEYLLRDSLLADLSASLADTTANYLQAALQIVDAFPDSANYEKSMQEVLSISLNTQLYQAGVFDAAQITNLQSIASLCPRYEGPAVLQARSVLPLCHRAQYDDMDSTCFGDVSLLQQMPPAVVRAEVEVENSVFTISPNPGQGEFTLQISPAYVGGQAHIHNLHGQRLRSYPLRAHAMYLTPELPTGVYLLNIQHKGQIPQSMKFIIH